MQSVLHLTPQTPFDFEKTVSSHGWLVLSPNAWDTQGRIMTRVEQLGSGRVVLLEISGQEQRVRIQVSHRGRLGERDTQDIRRRVRHMFRLDEDLDEFYVLCRGRGGHWMRATAGFGRLLRSPTVFEDAVKIICTTNTQWGGTKRMVAGLVEAYGEPYPGDAGRRAFPGPEKIAAVRPAKFAAQVRMGYRAPYVHELARRVVEGDLDLEGLPTAGMPTAELKKKILGIKGIGNYAAATLLMLLGRYDTLGVDSVCRDFVKKKYFEGRVPSDTEIHAVYENWGEWRSLAYWFELWDGFTGEF